MKAGDGEIVKQAKDVQLVHLTYSWYKEKIASGGLRKSADGLRGSGTYCCKA